jgi:hypothetical protein
MTRKPGVFDPWRQTPTPPPPAEAPAPAATDMDDDAPDAACFPFRGRRAGINVYLTGSDEPGSAAVRAIVDALEAIPEEARKHHGISTSSTLGAPTISVKSGARQYFCIVGDRKDHDAMRFAIDEFAHAFMEASNADPAVAAKLQELNVVPYRKH